MEKQKINWNEVETEATELLKKYLKIDTTNPPGNEFRGALFLGKILEDQGIDYELFEPEKGRTSLITSYQGKEEMAKVLLLHHIDVVPAEADNWKHSPFSGVEVDGEIWGRGAVDCKSLGIMQLIAFLLLKKQGINPQDHIIFAATADEEAGAKKGVEWLIKRFPEKLKARFVINEGVGFYFTANNRNLHFCQVAEKGTCWLRISFTGRPGHASMPGDGNCIYAMAKAVGLLSNHNFDPVITEQTKSFILEAAPYQNLLSEEMFLKLLDKNHTLDIIHQIPDGTFKNIIQTLFKNTAAGTVVSGGNKTNVIPGSCFCEVDCRILPGENPDNFKTSIENLLVEKGISNFSMDIISSSVASCSSSDTVYYKLIEEAFCANDPKAKVIPYMSSGATDSRFFRQNKIPSYGLQFGVTHELMKTIHGHDERISRKAIVFGIKVIHDIIKGAILSDS